MTHQILPSKLFNKNISCSNLVSQALIYTKWILHTGMAVTVSRIYRDSVL